MKTATCRSCETQFYLPIKRGRPPLKCEPCRGVAPAIPVAQPITIKGDRLYSRFAMVEALNNEIVDPSDPKGIVDFLRSISIDGRKK